MKTMSVNYRRTCRFLDCENEVLSEGDACKSCFESQPTDDRTIYLVWTGLGEYAFNSPKVEAAFLRKQDAQQWIKDNNINYGFGISEIKLR